MPEPYVPLGTNPWFGDPNQLRNCPAPGARCDQPVDPGRVIPAPTVNNGLNPAPADRLPAPPGPVNDPRLDILAVRPNLDIVVGVAITGTALAPHVRLMSEPDMSDTDKLSWLMLGRAPETVGGADTAPIHP